MIWSIWCYISESGSDMKCLGWLRGGTMKRPSELNSSSSWRPFREESWIIANGLQALKIAIGTYSLHACASQHYSVPLVQWGLCVEGCSCSGYITIKKGCQDPHESAYKNSWVLNTLLSSPKTGWTFQTVFSVWRSTVDSHSVASASSFIGVNSKDMLWFIMAWINLFLLFLERNEVFWKRIIFKTVIRLHRSEEWVSLVACAPQPDCQLIGGLFTAPLPEDGDVSR